MPIELPKIGAIQAISKPMHRQQQSQYEFSHRVRAILIALSLTILWPPHALVALDLESELAPITTAQAHSDQTPITRQLRQYSIWQPPANVQQLTREELKQVFSASPFAFLTEILGEDIPISLIKSLLSIKTRDLAPWNNFQLAPISEAELAALQSAKLDLNLPTNAEPVLPRQSYPISLEQALRLTLANNRSIQQRIIAANGTRQSLRQVQSSLFPSLKVGVKAVYGGDASEQETFEYPKALSGEISRAKTSAGGSKVTADSEIALRYSYPLLGGTLRPRLRQAKIEVEQADLNTELEIRDRLTDVLLAFYDTQSLKARVIITAQSLLHASQNFQDARMRLEAGRGDPLEASQAEVQLLREQQALIETLSNFVQSAYAFTNLLEFPLNVLAIPVMPLAMAGSWNLSLEDSVLHAFRNRLDLQEGFELEYARLQAALQAARAEALPTLSVQALGKLSANFEGEDRFGFVNGTRTRGSLTEKKTLKTEYTVGVFVDWEIQGRQSTARIQQAKLNLKNYDLRFIEKRDSIRDEVVNTFLTLRSNQKQVEQGELEVEVARKALDNAQQALRSGKASQNDLISTERDLTNAQFQLLGAIIGYNKALVRLQRVTGNRPDPNRIMQEFPPNKSRSSSNQP